MAKRWHLACLGDCGDLESLCSQVLCARAALGLSSRNRIIPLRFPVALSPVDRELLDRCLAAKPRAWEDFVDRFLGLVIHVINHSAQSRGLKLATHDIEDLAADV